MTTDEDSFVIIRYKTVDECLDRQVGTNTLSPEERGYSRGGGGGGGGGVGADNICDGEKASGGGGGVEGGNGTESIGCGDGGGGCGSACGESFCDGRSDNNCSSRCGSCDSRCDIQCSSRCLSFSDGRWDSRESRCCSMCDSAVTLTCSCGDQLYFVEDDAVAQCADGRGDGDMDGAPGYTAPPQVSSDFESISLTVSKLCKSMETMNIDMEKTDAAVRGVTHRLKQQGQIVQQLHRAMGALEKKACLLIPPSPLLPTSPSLRKLCVPLLVENEIDLPGNRFPTRSPSVTNSSIISKSTWSPSSSSPSPSVIQTKSCLCCAQSSGSRSSSPVRCVTSKSPKKSVSFSGTNQNRSRSPSPMPRGSSTKIRAPPVTNTLPSPTQSEIRIARRTTFLSKKLLRAAENGSLKRVRKLLSKGADPNFSAPGRWTALHKASAESHAKVVSLLLKKGAHPNARTTYGFSALHMAAYNDTSGRCVKHLVRAKADLDVRNRSGRTPLHHAAESGNVAAVRLLLKAGASKYVKNNDGRTPFHVAKTVRVRRRLLSSGRKRSIARSSCV